MSCSYCKDSGITLARHKFKQASEFAFRCWCELGIPNPDKDIFNCIANRYTGLPRWESGFLSHYIPESEYGGDEDIYWGVVRALPERPTPAVLNEFLVDLVKESPAHRALRFKYKDMDLPKIYKEWQEWSKRVKMEEVRDQNEDTNASSDGGVQPT